ncbi:MAG: hypothetical protein JXK95_08105, partial [Bacteroidales bacterium]|nr:hypothetical protein [Bacteroidales bacterium]
MKRKIFIAFLMPLTFCTVTYSQVVSGIINHYLKVDSVLTDGVRVENTGELSYFEPGDKALLIQMTGATHSGTPTSSEGYMISERSCGKFEILQVAEITGSTEKYVSFTDDIDNTYNHGEKIQLVRIMEGDKITINEPVTAKAWDGNSGGIVA